jgi:hypothetical protein
MPFVIDMAFPALMGKIGGGLGVSKAWRNGFSAAATLGQIFGALVRSKACFEIDIA